MAPSRASRVAFFAAEAAPFLRRMSTAPSRSPLDSTSAFLQSIRPAPVISRSLPTNAGVMSAIGMIPGVFQGSVPEYDPVAPAGSSSAAALDEVHQAAGAGS